MRNMLTHHFVVIDNQLVRKTDIKTDPKEPAATVKQKKRITPLLIVDAPAPKTNMQEINNSTMTAGQKRFKNKLLMIERKEDDKKLRNAFNKLRNK